MMSARHGILCVAGLALILALPCVVQARPLYLQVWKETYPDRRDNEKCAICHFGERRSVYNDYGRAIKDALGAKQVTETTVVEAALKKAEDRWPDKDKDAIQGKWMVVKIEYVNQEAVDSQGAMQWDIKDGKLVILKSGESVVEGKFKLNAAKKPKQFEMSVEYGGPNVTTTGIYSLAGDELTICCGPDGDTDPPATLDLKKAPPGVTRWTLRREKGDKVKGKEPETRPMADDAATKGPQ